MAAVPKTIVIVIHRKQNGGAYVEPGVTVAQNGDTLVFKNIERALAKVAFAAAVVNPAEFDVPAKGMASTLVAGEAGYYGYDVLLGRIGGVAGWDEAWGGSRPGLIIE